MNGLMETGENGDGDDCDYSYQNQDWKIGELSLKSKRQKPENLGIITVSETDSGSKNVKTKQLWLYNKFQLFTLILIKSLL